MERPGVMFLHDEHRGSITPALALVAHGLRRLRGVPLGPIRPQSGRIVPRRSLVAPLVAARHEGSLPQLRPLVGNGASRPTQGGWNRKELRFTRARPDTGDTEGQDTEGAGTRTRRGRRASRPGSGPATL